MTPWEKHKAKWKGCNRCDLCTKRGKVVLLRGSIPAPILFVGEAPGHGEDSLGQPFKGPAGKLLDRTMEAAGVPSKSYAITNLIGCIPYDEFLDKVSDPPLWAVQACAERLQEVVIMVKPKLIVRIGDVAKKHLERSLGELADGVEMADLTHPAAILRANVTQRGLMYQRNVVALSDAIEGIV